MANRTVVIGDIHGDMGHMKLLFRKLPALEKGDTLVFLGDYVDRGPASREVVAWVRKMQRELPCKVVCLRGNHEDAWLRVLERGWPEFVLPPSNGCLATMRSYDGGPVPEEDETPTEEEFHRLNSGAFFPQDVIDWFFNLPYWYEDRHAIYVHAGLLERGDKFMHPRDTEPKTGLLWTRTEGFFTGYRGKPVVVGHTHTELLPPELSSYTAADPGDMWAGPAVFALDTGAGKGGFLTALELPGKLVYESRYREAG